MFLPDLWPKVHEDEVFRLDDLSDEAFPHIAGDEVGIGKQDVDLLFL